MAYTTIDDPTDYFNTKIFTGDNSANNAVTGVGFQPDFIWFKNRSAANDHALVDSVRGRKALSSNNTSAELTLNADKDFQSFDSDGFTVDVVEQLNSFNKSGDSIVTWNWLAGTTGSGTTTGTGTGKAYSYSVNTTSGFSIVKYLGNGSAGHTIPHHLGAVPKMIILKRDAATNWSTYHASTGNGKSDPLNEAEVPTTSTSFWNDTTPTSSVFTVGSISNTNSNDSSIIAYCFAEKQGYSKFGSYTGNGNVSGPMIVTGMKPAWTMIKRTSSNEGWYINDTTRLTTNPNDQYLRPNAAGEEGTTPSLAIDLLSNGIKMRGTDSGYNESGSTYIYMAFAENPFVTSSGVPACAR